MANDAGLRIVTQTKNGEVEITVYAGAHIRSPQRKTTLPANASATQTVQLVAGMILELKRHPQQG